MLMDPKWTQESPPTLLDRMIDWLELQPKDDWYSYFEPHQCACGRFAKARGYMDEWLAAIHGPYNEFKQSEWYRIDRLAHGTDRTYGEMLERCKAARKIELVTPGVR